MQAKVLKLVPHCPAGGTVNAGTSPLESNLALSIESQKNVCAL